MNKRTQITFFFSLLTVSAYKLKSLCFSLCLTPFVFLQHHPSPCSISPRRALLPSSLLFILPYLPLPNLPTTCSHFHSVFFSPILSFLFSITPHYHGSNDILEPHCRMKPLTPFPRAGNQPFTVEKAKIATILSPILVIFSTLSLKAPAPRIM